MKRRSDIASVPGARWPLGSLPPCRGLGLCTRSLAHRAIALRRPPVSRLLGTQGTRRRSRGPLGSPVPNAGLRASSTHRPASARGVGPWHRPRADAGQPRAGAGSRGRHGEHEPLLSPREAGCSTLTRRGSATPLRREAPGLTNCWPRARCLRGAVPSGPAALVVRVGSLLLGDTEATQPVPHGWASLTCLHASVTPHSVLCHAGPVDSGWTSTWVLAIWGNQCPKQTIF